MFVLCPGDPKSVVRFAIEFSGRVVVIDQLGGLPSHEYSGEGAVASAIFNFAWLAALLSVGCTQSALTFVGRAPASLSDDELCATATWVFGPSLTGYLNEMRRRDLIDNRDEEAIVAREMSQGISRCAAVAIHVKPPVSEQRLDDRTVKLVFGGRLDLNVVYRPRHEVILREGRVAEWN